MLYELSYTNLIMLGAALPSYDTDKDDKSDDDEVIDASDPANQARVRERCSPCCSDSSFSRTSK